MALSSGENQVRLNKKKKIYKLTPYLFITPQILLFLVFFIAPALIGIYTAFTKWDIFTSELPEFVGLNNFKEILLKQDSTYFRLFWQGLRNTLTFVVISVPFCIVIPLLLAVALNTKTKGYKIFQSIFYMPNVLAISTVILTWYYCFNRSLGLINNVFHININWLRDQPYTWIAIVIITVWWTMGANMVIYVAALTGVSKDILESASIDGAGARTKFFKIVIPSIRNQLAYTIVLTTILQFNIYGQPLMISEKGPDNTTRVLLIAIREIAFPSNGGKSISGIASAMALMLGIMIIIVSLILYKVTSKEE